MINGVAHSKGEGEKKRLNGINGIIKVLNS